MFEKRGDTMTEELQQAAEESKSKLGALREIVPAKLPATAERSCWIWATRAGRFFTCRYIPEADKRAAMELMMAARQRAMDAAAQEYAAL